MKAKHTVETNLLGDMLHIKKSKTQMLSFRKFSTIWMIISFLKAKERFIVLFAKNK